jgi:hypothetical protein
MSLHLYRAIVRGQFADLADDVRAGLLSTAAEHDYLHAAFTPEGTLVYDERLVAFSLRYELRVEAADPATAGADAEAEATARAMARLEAAGIGAKHLRVALTDMASMWQRASGARPGPRR